MIRLRDLRLLSALLAALTLPTACSSVLGGGDGCTENDTLCQAPETCGGRGETDMCGMPAADRLCSEDGWCWEYPLPHGYAIRGAHFRAPDDGWAVGDEGHVQHWNGTKWARVSSGTAQRLNDVHAVSATDIWAVGSGGTVLHSSGGAFSPVASGTSQELLAIWASGPTEVWAVGASGTLLRNQGNGFQAVDASTTETLNDVWGSGPGDVWVVGNGGTVRHHDGTTLSVIDTGTALPFYEVTGSGPDEVWTVTSEDPCSVCDDYGVVYRVTPSGLTESFHSSDQLFHVFAAGPSAVHTVGESSRYRWDGEDWRKTPGPGTNGDLAGSGPEDVWLFSGASLVERWDGHQWTTRTPYRALGNLVDVHGDDTSDVWALESGGRVLHWNGNRWKEHTAFSFSSTVARGLYVASSGTTWLVTSGASPSDNRIYRGNGSSFDQELGSNALGLLAVHGSSETDVWAVGHSGEALHRDDSGWKHQPTGASATLNDVWVESPTLVIAVGDSGTIQRWNGDKWTAMSSGTGASLQSVWGSGPTDIWASGAGGTLLHYNGASWSAVTSGTRVTLNALWGVSPSAVWTTGDEGTLLRYDGSRWTAERTGTRGPMKGLWAASGSEVWLVGNPAILHKP